MTLAAPSLAELGTHTLAARVGGNRLDLASAVSTAYLRRLESAQQTLALRIRRGIRGSEIRWHYTIVANGLAVVVPPGDVARLARIPGVARVWPNMSYRPTLDRTPKLIGAPDLWGPGLTTAGNGMKIGIIDQGIDQTHPFFSPAGFTYPPGFPKGNTAYTTPKVIVARVFSRPGATDPLETLPFVGVNDVDDHGTHVAGIAAGDANTEADGVRISGIAPKAYLGNYKALSIPSSGFGLNGNTPELVAAIEAAVKDGMDVINLSLGEPEVAPSRDLVVKALDAAAAAGVVPVASAGNDYEDYGSGSISSPASAPEAIAVAASTGGHGSPRPDRIASFSSKGPTAFTLRLKPDVTAPGALVLSSVPAAEGSWDEISGTSMAAPHVAGAAALLAERHPTWTVAQIKSALVLTGVPVRSGNVEVPATREGGGRIDLPRADNPLLFAAPTSVSFEFLRPGRRAIRTIALTDAGGGGGAWTGSVRSQTRPRGVSVSVPKTVSVPGKLPVSVRVPGAAPQGDFNGFVILTRAGNSRRIPVWFRVERPRLALDRAHPLVRPGVYRGSTVGAPSRVASYRYPDLTPTTVPFRAHLPGAEVVYRFRLNRRVANFGVVVTRRDPGVNVQPRIVRNGDENQLAGYTALPLDLNDYRASYGESRPVSAVVLPAPGTYDVVFDSPGRARRGSFSFRFWIGDTTPPSVRVLSSSGGVLRLGVRDSGSGVDPRSLEATVAGRARTVSFARGVARITGLASGSQALTFRASDYQETKNIENVGPVLPNTRTLRTTVRVS